MGLVYGQALRIIERCSDPSDADLHLENLCGKLLSRNYPENLIQKKQFTKAKKSDRKKLITQSRKKKKDDKVRCMFTFNEGNPPLHQAKKCSLKNEKAKNIGEQAGAELCQAHAQVD